jgi:hypothetical protein
MNTGTEERRLVIEIITTLANLKKILVELILKPSGVPADIYQTLLNQRDDTTGSPLTKRQMAPLILDAVDKRIDCEGVIRNIIEVAANWSNFHLANDEFAARATVQKAREMLGTIKLMDEREAKQREITRKQEVERMDKEREERLSQQSELLLMMFEDLVKLTDAHRRGYLLQDLLNRLFDLHGIAVISSFTRNNRSEQIDGAIKLDGWHYLIECRWRKKLADIRELDGVTGQVGRSGKQTMGFFISINGWSDNVPNLLKQNSEKSVILMDGYDLRCVLTRQIDLRDFISAKIEKLNLKSEPFLGATEYLNNQ